MQHSVSTEDEPQNAPLSEADRDRMRRFLVGMTEHDARRAFGGISPQTFARALAGLSLQKGTRLLIVSKLDEVRAR
jgi:hypothetical protein